MMTMASSQILSLARETPLVLTQDVSFPPEEVRAAFETICATEEDTYRVLYTVTGRDDKSNNWMAVLCRSVREAAEVQERVDGDSQVGVYALQKTSAASINLPITAVASQRRRSRPSLLPGAPLFLREYTVVTRQEAETRATTGVVAPPTSTIMPVEAAASVVGERPERLPEVIPLNEHEELPVTRLRLTATEVVAPLSRNFPQQKEMKELPKESGEKKKKQQQQPQTLFGSTLVAEKHARESTKSSTTTEPRAKKSRRTKSIDETPSKNTTSLLKLAKASKKNKVFTSDLAVPTARATTTATSTINNNNNNNKRNNTNTKTISASQSNGQGLLDEEEELDACHGNSINSENHSSTSSSGRNNSFFCNREFLNEEEQNLDVVITAVANDDIIICDDAPPMVFCAPEAFTCSLKKEQQQQKQCGSAVGLDQPKLTGFFHPEIGTFQKTYIRDVKTETVFENDEYISRDVVYYRHKESGEPISEEEYHRRSIEVTRKLCEKTQKTNSSSCIPGDTLSPAADSKERKLIEVPRNSRPPNIERQMRSQPKTLMSYFKPLSA